ncbi:MAG: hypothetical protein KKC75_08000 [Nanoarchaeota archaeon]|nr:hypothetical protein [Nanoarchaeota archaeon]MBU1005272.1 hypothetical protein [Nanoarchaeota archaeon]MBU1947009.1 hypothetical protein [Nanoarchaeota archaeon]
MVEQPLNPMQEPPEQKKHKGLFTKEKPDADIKSVSPELESTINRLRVLEERYTNLQTEVRITEENMIKRNKKLSTDIKTLTSDITEIRNEVNEVKDKILMIIKELQMGAKRADVEVLRKYIDMWEPMNFVTHKEVEDLIDEKLKEKG